MENFVEWGWYGFFKSLYSCIVHSVLSLCFISGILLPWISPPLLEKSHSTCVLDQVFMSFSVSTTINMNSSFFATRVPMISELHFLYPSDVQSCPCNSQIPIIKNILNTHNNDIF